MSVLASPSSPSASHGSVSGQLQLLPLKHSFGFHGTAMPNEDGKSLSLLETAGKESSRKRKNATPMVMGSIASTVKRVHFDPRPPTVMSVAHITHADDTSLGHSVYGPQSLMIQHGLSHTIWPGPGDVHGLAHSAPASSRGLHENQPDIRFARYGGEGLCPGKSFGLLSQRSPHLSTAASSDLATRITSADSRAASPSHYKGTNNTKSPLTTVGPTSAYQMVTVQTSSGTIQIPVDMQAASSFANEKRRRNAGASVRFRERRKRKEVESSSTILKLESQVKQLSEDLQYYRQERDYFANAVLQSFCGDQHYPRTGGSSLIGGSPQIRRRSHGFSAARTIPGDSSNYLECNQEQHAWIYNGQEPRDECRMIMGVSNTPEPQNTTYSHDNAAAPSLKLCNPPPLISESLCPHTVGRALPRPSDVYSQRRESFDPPSTSVPGAQQVPDPPTPVAAVTT